MTNLDAPPRSRRRARVGSPFGAPGRVAAVLAAATVAALLGSGGTTARAAQEATPPEAASDPGPGCTPERPAVAHRAGAVALDPQPAVLPFPCTTVTGHAIEAATMGVTDTGTVFFGSIEERPGGPRTIVNASVLARSTDLGATWENVVPSPTPTSTHGSLSPWMSVDHDTSRIWYATPTAPCGATVSWSDDDGETWQENPNIGCPAQGAAVLIEGPAPAGTEEPEGYPHIVYYCANAQDGTESVLACHRSRDGGRTFRHIESTPDPIPAEEGCEPTDLRRTRTGIVGTTDGVLYFPTWSCDKTSLGVAVSDDQGATWTRRDILSTEVEDLYPPAMASDRDGVLYLAWKGADGLPYLSISHDLSQSWSEPRMIAPPGVTAIDRLGLVTHEPGHILVSYLATSDGGATFDAWMTESRDAAEPDPVFWSATANDPGTPVLTAEGQADEIYANRIQFLRGHIADDGTAWAGFHCYETELCPDERLGLASRLYHPSAAPAAPTTDAGPPEPPGSRREALPATGAGNPSVLVLPALLAGLLVRRRVRS